MAEPITICDQVFLDERDERNELLRDNVAKFMPLPSGNGSSASRGEELTASRADARCVWSRCERSPLPCCRKIVSVVLWLRVQLHTKYVEGGLSFLCAHGLDAD
jgi:hypothetical protein